MKRCLSVMACAALACSAAWAGQKHFFMLVPPDMEEWVASAPMISTDGGVTGKPMTAYGYLCGWYEYTFADNEATDNVVIFRDDDATREDMLGVNGNWETGSAATPISLKTIFSMVDSLFFVPDESQKTNADGFYYNVSEVTSIEGICSYELSWIVYDSDAKLHPAFSCYSAGGEGCQFGAQDVDTTAAVKAVNDCIGVTPGIVESTLDATTKKPKLTAEGKKCFIDEKYFNQLFNYTENVNEMSCYDMPVLHMQQGGWWEFNSDYYIAPGTQALGGFFPVETTTDETVKLAGPDQTPVAAARTKRDAEGPVFYGPSLRKLDSLEGVPVMDLLCNGPGWNKGLDCEGMFADGGTTEAFVQTAFNLPKTYPENCVFGWSCETTAPEGWQFYKNGTDTPVQKQVDPTGYRWTSTVKADGTGGRNHHFCYETHAKFTYKPGLRLALRGSDDIWAFIDNKLAIDLGGVHLDAPGYVSLDAFKGASGTLVDGNMYDVDIFACDRRTTMSNLQIRTNMFMQSLNDVAIQIKSAKNAEKPAESDYSICYTRMTGTCGISGEPETICIDTSTVHKFTQVSYTLVNGVSLTDSIVDGFKDLSTPGVYHGGIDLTNIASPVVDKSKINLPEGRYTLFVNIDGKSAKVMTFRIGTDVIKPVARIAGASFTVKNSLPQALTITVTNSAAKYAVMDLQGRVVRQGMLAGAETVVPNLNPGSYIVKVARETRRVNVR